MDDTILLKLRLGKLLGILSRDLAGILQHLTVSGIQEDVDALFPILHCHGDVTLRHVLGYVKVGIDKPSHGLQLVLTQIILGNGNIRLDDLAIGSFCPGGQSHVFFLSVCSLHDEFRCCMPMHGIVHLVLHFLEKTACSGCVLVIVNRRGINVGQLLVEVTLRQANLAYLLQ